MITFMRELLSYVLSSEESLTSIRSTTSMAPRPSFTSSSMALEKKQCVALKNIYHSFALYANHAYERNALNTLTRRRLTAYANFWKLLDTKVTCVWIWVYVHQYSKRMYDVKIWLVRDIDCPRTALHLGHVIFGLMVISLDGQRMVCLVTT